MSTTSDIKDVYSDEDYFEEDEVEESDINYLKDNLIEEDLYTQLFNKYKFNKIMSKNVSKSEDKLSDGEKEIENKEQIDETKLKMVMVFINKFDISEEDQKNISCFYDFKTRHIKAERVVIQNCSIENKKLKEENKSYLFILKKENNEINNTTISINDSQNNDMNNQKNNNNINNNMNNQNNIITTFNNIQNNSINDNNNIQNESKSADSIKIKKPKEIFCFNYNNKSYKLIKYNKSDKTEDELIEKDKSISDKEIKAYNEKDFKKKFLELKEEKTAINDENKSKKEREKIGNSQPENTNSEKFSMKTDNSDKEIFGNKFYFINDDNNCIKRYIFRGYSKEVDGFYTRHKALNLGKKGICNTLTKQITKFEIENDLFAHIIYKNFKEDTIPENEPIIIEVKKSFKLYDLLIQIKQISKFGNNLYYKDGKKCDLFPKYIIGFMCSNQNDDIRNKNLEELDKKYNETDTLLAHDLKVIDANKVNVVICVIEKEKIKGYDLSQGDYFINKEKAIYRIDLNFLCDTIFPNENKSKEIEEVFKKYENRYESLKKEKSISMLEHKRLTESLQQKIDFLNKNNLALQTDNMKLASNNQQLTSKIENLNNERNQLILDYESRIKELEEENQKLKKMQNKNENKEENSESKKSGKTNSENKNG